jgi:hypothetical protein
VRIDTDKPAIDQLWDEVRGIIEFSNAKMKSFLELFGIEVRNGLSPFAVSVENPSDLSAIIVQFFKRPKVDIRGRCGQFSTHTTNHGGVGTSVDEEEMMMMWMRMRMDQSYRRTVPILRLHSHQI